MGRRDFLRLGAAGLAGLAVGGSSLALPTEALAAGAKFEPPRGHVYTGVSLTRPQDFSVAGAVREWNRWTDLMRGKPAAISHEYAWFDNWTDHAYKWARARKATPMVSIEFTNVSTKSVAGAGAARDGTRTDHYILRHAHAARTYGGRAFVRLGHEMNGHWYSYCAYNRDGSPRQNTVGDYKQAWRRFVILFRGGYVRDVNARLAAYGMPPLDANAAMPEWMGYPSLSDPGSYIPPVNNVAFVWCPMEASLPNVAGNAAVRYYPGDGFVDWVGQDVYHAPWWNSLDSHFRRMDAFYRKFCIEHGKPYMLAEWGLVPPSAGPKGTKPNDNPEFINRVLDWTAKRPKAKALIYWSWYRPQDGDHRLQKFPRAARALAYGWKRTRFSRSIRG
jgi:hypothetical protein